MIYTVTWTDAAIAALADLWNQATDKAAVSAASNEIDKELRVDAHRKGHASEDGRVFIIHPLMVVFAVDAGDCMVRVLQVWRV